MPATNQEKATRTRTRKTDSDKAEATAAEQAEKAARAAEKAAAKEQRDKEKAEAKAVKDAEREQARAQKEAARAAERQALIDSGSLIEVEVDGVTHSYVESEPKKEAVALRAAQVIEDLKAANGTPVRGKDLAEKYGGGTVQWVAFFGMLRTLGLVKAYRVRTGTRGESGLAYSWVGDK